MAIGEQWLPSRWDIGRAVASSSDNVSGISKYQYSWDSGAWTDCSDPWGYGNLYEPYGPGEGIHTVIFRAQNGAGLWSGSSAAAKWKIDETAPYYKWELKSGSVVDLSRGKYTVTLNFYPLARDDLSGAGSGYIYWLVDSVNDVFPIDHETVYWKGSPWDDWSISFPFSSGNLSNWASTRLELKGTRFTSHYVAQSFEDAAGNFVDYPPNLTIKLSYDKATQKISQFV